MESKDLTEAAAVVTGHTRGLGEGIARHLLSRGVRVLGISRHGNPDLVRAHAEALTEVRLDLADTAALTAWLQDDTLATFLRGPDTALLVNNAGVLEPIGPLESQDIDMVGQAAAINVAAPLMLSAAFVAATGDSRDRRILHISSGAGSHAYAGWSIYCASKAALDHHARAVALDGTPGLRIASVAPGVIDTDMQTLIRAADEEDFPERERFIELKREGRLRDPDEAGREVAALLLSDEFGREIVTDLRR